MKTILRSLLYISVSLLLFMLVTAILLIWGVGGGMLLLRFTRLEFSLFEASLLHLMAVLFIIFKRTRGGHQGTPKISMASLKKQMNKMGQKPYDDDILRAAVSATNYLLEENEQLITIIRLRLWDEPLN
jgi:hypothetical protein